MALGTSAPDPVLIADLPVTLAGLWTAVTLTHQVAAHLVDRCPPESSELHAAVAGLLAGAAQSLAGSRPDAMLPAADPPPRWRDPLDTTAAVDDLASACIDLAVEVLGNHDEPLTSFEVLAITRAVTALCTARSIAQGGIA